MSSPSWLFQQVWVLCAITQVTQAAGAWSCCVVKAMIPCLLGSGFGTNSLGLCVRQKHSFPLGFILDCRRVEVETPRFQGVRSIQ